MSGFDLSTAPDLGVLEDEGIPVELVDLDGEDVGATIWMAGRYSNRYRKAQNALQTMRIKRGGKKIDGAQIDKEGRGVIASCALRWEGFSDSGEIIECNRANVNKVFELAPHFQEQCSTAMEDHAAFMKKS